MGATTCLEISGAECLCAEVPHATPPGSVPSWASSTKPSKERRTRGLPHVIKMDPVMPGKIEALWQGFHRRAAADRCRSGHSLACVGAAGVLAEGLWREGALAQAGTVYADAHARCEWLSNASPGPRAELLLAEILLSQALVTCELCAAAYSGGSAAAAYAVAPMDLLRKSYDLARRHELAEVPLQAARAALIAAVAVQNLGKLCLDRGDKESARVHFEEALARLCEARASAQTPRLNRAAPRVPRHVYMEQVQRNLLRCGEGAEATSVMWWQHGGLAKSLHAMGDADAALAHKLCAAALLGLDDDADAEPARGTDEARCDIWLDISDDLAARGDMETATVYRDRAYRHAQAVGLPAGSRARRRAWTSLASTPQARQ